jgi:hypothetical protein
VPDWRHEVCTALEFWRAAEEGSSQAERLTCIGSARPGSEPGWYHIDLRGTSLDTDQVESLRLSGGRGPRAGPSYAVKEAGRVRSCSSCTVPTTPANSLRTSAPKTSPHHPDAGHAKEQRSTCAAAARQATGSGGATTAAAPAGHRETGNPGPSPSPEESSPHARSAHPGSGTASPSQAAGPRQWPRRCLAGERMDRPGGRALRVACLRPRVGHRLLATSLYEDPSAGMHEDASARLREHSAPRLLDLAPALATVQCERPPRSPLSATRRAPCPSQRATGISGHCTAGQLQIADSARLIPEPSASAAPRRLPSSAHRPFCSVRLRACW